VPVFKPCPKPKKKPKPTPRRGITPPVTGSIE
jgi:hypothetical protein